MPHSLTMKMMVAAILISPGELSWTHLFWQAPVIVALKGEDSKGILVQDTDLNLYLIDKSGNAIWKKQLESIWKGEAYALELFEGAGNVLTFNTETNWHLLDQDGADMAGFSFAFQGSCLCTTFPHRDGR